MHSIKNDSTFYLFMVTFNRTGTFCPVYNENSNMKIASTSRSLMMHLFNWNNEVWNVYELNPRSLAEEGRGYREKLFQDVFKLLRHFLNVI